MYTKSDDVRLPERRHRNASERVALAQPRSERSRRACEGASRVRAGGRPRLHGPAVPPRLRVQARFERSRAAACRRFRPATGDGFAIHPYGLLSPPESPMRHRDDVNLGKLGALQDALDRLQRRRAPRATTRRLGIYIDEYGYQTEPPDRFAGVSPHPQDRWLQQPAYLAWRSPRVKLLTQYLCRDEPRSGDGSYGGWQSGLRLRARAREAEPRPLRHAVRARRRARPLWGQVRPGGAHELVVERRLRGGSWRTFAHVRTDARGYWTLRRRVSPGAAYRYRVDRTTSAVRRR